jgi:excisionase family DNA binding protein
MKPVEVRAEALMTTSEVAKIFRVTRTTIIRWIEAGQFTDVRTPTGRRRVRAAEVRDAAADGGIRTAGRS